MKYRKAAFAAALVTSAALATPANAWTALDKEGECGFVGLFEGPGNTRIMLKETYADFQENEVWIAVMNDNWSLEEGDDTGTIKFENSINEAWLSNTATAVTNGFALMTRYEYVDDVFGESNYGALTLYRDGKEFDGLKMGNMFSVWRKYEACRRPWVAAREKVERDREIEQKYGGDPFAD